MCLAVPAKILKVQAEDIALCDFNGVEKEVNVALIDNPTAGDWVIVHVGFALNHIDEKEAQTTLEMLSTLQTPNVA